LTIPEGPKALLAGHILPFDEQAALLWARLMAEGKTAGRPRNELDMITDHPISILIDKLTPRLNQS
jgi:predicted nucleic acid-binding protein